jgi:hypothetical protein
MFFFENIIGDVDLNQGILEIPDYPRPVNRNFWLEEELRADAQEILESVKKRLDKVRLFSFNNAEELIKDKMDHIIKLVQIMVDSNPENPNGVAGSLGYIYLGNYMMMKERNPNYNIDENQFNLIRKVDIKKFQLLAEKFFHLSQLRESNRLHKKNIPEMLIVRF